MQLFLASAALAEIQWATRLGIIDGIVATPAVIAADLPQAEPRDVVAEIAEATSLPIVASVGSVHAAEIVKGGKELAKLADRIVVAIPFVEDAIPAIKRLSGDGVRVAATLISSAAQGIIASRAGASMLTVSVDALAVTGDQADRVIAELRALLDRSHAGTDLFAAGPANAEQFTRCGISGADGAVVTATQLRSFLQHPLTDRGLDRFLGDLVRRAKPRRAK